MNKRFLDSFTSASDLIGYTGINNIPIMYFIYIPITLFIVAVFQSVIELYFGNIIAFVVVVVTVVLSLVKVTPVLIINNIMILRSRHMYEFGLNDFQILVSLIIYLCSGLFISYYYINNMDILYKESK